MTTHYDDEEQAERLKQWWHANWKSLASGLVIGLAAIFGWQGWQNHSDTQHAQASRMYEDLRAALAGSNDEAAEQIADTLTQQYAKSPYATGAALYMAKKATEAGQFDNALTRLQWVREHGADDGLKQVATLRAARVLWAKGDIDKALAMIDTKPGPFEGLSQELRGDILLAKGDRADAVTAYQKALSLASGDDDAALRSGLQRKIDSLADVAQAS